MLLDDYLNEIENTLNTFSSLIVNQSVTIDKRPQEQAHIFGILLFNDESTLHFREFIDASEGKIDKVAYSYHFQDKSNALLFRYDNAKHKPALDFVEHKHFSGNITYAPDVTLQDSIQEAMLMIQFV